MRVESTFINIDKDNINLLNSFLSAAGTSLQTFRYYDKRDLKVIENHLCTYILMAGQKPIGYGHLDREGSDIWLGIAVSDSELGKGYGEKILCKLLDAAVEFNLKEIRLSVDVDNRRAIKLYEKHGFKLEDRINNTYFFKRINPHEHTSIHS